MAPLGAAPAGLGAAGARPRPGAARDHDHRGSARRRPSAARSELMAGKVRGRIVVRIRLSASRSQRLVSASACAIARPTMMRITQRTQETRMTRYADFHRRSIDDRDAFWAEQAELIDWHTPFDAGLRLQQPAVREVVRRRHDQPVPQRGRPAPGHARRPERADLRLDRDRPGEGLQLPRTARRGAAHGRRCLLSLGVKQGDRVLIYMPMIPEAAFAMLACARIGAHPLGGVRRLRQRQPGQPHRRCRAHGDRQRRRRQPRRQGGALQAAARRGDPAGRAQAGQGADGRPRPGRDSRRVAGRDEDYAALREQAHRRAGALRLGRVDAPELHALHQRHHRQAQGRAARHRRLRGGAGREHEAHLPAASRARPTSPPATSAGWSATATSSTAR